MDGGNCARIDEIYIACLSNERYLCPPEVIYYPAIDCNTNTNSRLICTWSDPLAVSYPHCQGGPGVFVRMPQ